MLSNCYYAVHWLTMPRDRPILWKEQNRQTGEERERERKREREEWRKISSHRLSERNVLKLDLAPCRTLNFRFDHYVYSCSIIFIHHTCTTYISISFFFVLHSFIGESNGNCWRLLIYLLFLFELERNPWNLSCFSFFTFSYCLIIKWIRHRRALIWIWRLMHRKWTIISKIINIFSYTVNDWHF